MKLLKRPALRIFAVLIVAVLLLSYVSGMPIDVWAEEYEEGDYTYTVSNGEATITLYTGTGGDVTIPTTLGDYPVTGIDYSAFEGCEDLNSVVIGNGVTTIGDSAFCSCPSLTSVTIGNSVTTIGVGAFDNCTSLTTITIPDNVTYIGSYAFYDCVNLTSVIIGNGVTAIDYEMFYNCASLTSVTIPNSVTSINYDAFFGCTSLTEVAYDGLESEWAEVTIDEGNEALTQASFTFRSLYGDANGDGEVNEEDVSVIMKYLAGWNLEIELELADVNGDGMINTKDSLRLLKYLNGYDVTLG